MNFSSPTALLGLGKVPSLIQETKVLARPPAGFFLPENQDKPEALSKFSSQCLTPGNNPFRSSAGSRYSPVTRFSWLKNNNLPAYRQSSSTTFLEEFDE
ncbi:hypothetical protein [Pseudomonas fluorescens]|uniref:Uncharacterized protein n=1 Tax=Pseudomonas fluorescens TaxID=294 RepID=A0A944HCW4_PSEFL|nr:hypothetical protein [Pseudomonas fluorescens]MBT2311941.1 hypothetical protein [Pseudomonas fluorescens]MBT2316892.1 hypothetical protein [Pseudomonas fluorescens]MBT2330025.1 hypothetical protein [Pseudomonas fluorescens]MBT2344711.1 hypothetical protein [Pseudomonas fluorescens]MBT2347899.1 hypothetical protein [Pseudomonas fluorescens]